eukprot:TRINITY_DN3020_c0_g1_i2.p1 TRINITY_DN3020_c0_g1~~TRINITY_DN3020_c0_g1_i2.p1  ORF type:complete len:1064 (+),score=240.87 TRINITY_DN3020_c0_g1_i2:630-3821(+)
MDEQQNRKDWSKHKDGSICLDAIGEDAAIQEAMSTDPSFDMDDNMEFHDLFGLSIRDLNGVDCRLGDIISNRFTLLVMASQFGAPTTKKFLSDLMKQWDTIEDLGIQIVIIGTASPIASGIFRKDFGLPPVIFSDVDKKVYRELGCRRGFRWAYSPQAFSAMVEAVGQGHRASQGVGDALQLGGVFLLSKEDGISYQHIERYGGFTPDLSELVPQLANFVRKRPYIWSTAPALSWNDLGYSTMSGSKSSAFNISDRSWHVERGIADAASFNASSGQIFTDFDDMPYRRYFFGQEHVLYTSAVPLENEDGEVDHNCSCIVAATPDVRGDRKIVIYHASGIHKRIIPAYRVASGEKEAIQAAVARIAGVHIELRRVDPVPLLQEELLNYEHTQMIKNFKFGVLNCRDGQTEESDIYGNTEVSPAYEEFLQFLGNRLPLRGWTGYKGGLDVKKDVSGTHAITASVDDTNVIFHVASMIPLDKDPEQSLLERKRHIGNDVVVVIFKEGPQQLDPSVWRSQFNHVFVVVSKDERKSQKEDGKTVYRVEVAFKPQCPAALPALPDPPSFEKGRDFHKFLLSKLVNAERSTTRVAPVFKQKMDKMRGLVLRDAVQAFNSDPMNTKSAVLISGRLKVRKSKSDASSTAAPSVISTPMKINPPSFANNAVSSTKDSSSGNSSPREPLSVSFAIDPPRSQSGSAVPSTATKKGRHSRSQSRDSNSSKDAIVSGPRPVLASSTEKEDIFSALEADIANFHEPAPVSPSTSASSDKIEKASSQAVSTPVISKRSRGDSERLERKKSEKEEGDKSRTDSKSTGESRRRPPSRSTSNEKPEKHRIKTSNTPAPADDVSSSQSASESASATPPKPAAEQAGSAAAANAAAENSAAPAPSPAPASAPAEPPANAMSTLEASLRELEAVEKAATQQAQTRRQHRPPPADGMHRNKSFQQLQAQWRSLAAQNQSSASAKKQSSASLPLVHEADELAAVVQQVLAQVGHGDASKRIVVVNSADENDKDIVSLKNDMTAAELITAIEQSTGKKVQALTFQGVTVRDKHIRLFNDKDAVQVKFV